MAKYECVQCKKERPGRFTRPKISGSGQWKKHGITLPHWYCWTCLPDGQGKGETEAPQEVMDVAKIPVAAPAPKSTTDEAREQAQEVLAIVPTLQQEVKELAIVDAGGYAYADTLLGRIRSQRKGWGAIWGRIQDKTIRPLRASLDGLYELNRDIDGPLEKLENAVKKTMKDFKTEEARQIAAANEEKERERIRLEQEAAEKAKQAEQARTPQLRGRLTNQAVQLQQQAATVAQQEAPTPVRGTSSTTRTTPAWRLKDPSAIFDFLQDILDGKIPAEAILLNKQYIDSVFKSQPEVIMGWSGIELYDDIQVVGR